MKRKPHTPDEKAKLVLEVLRGERLLNEIASENEIHPNMLSKWKKEAVAGLPSVFENDAAKKRKEQKVHEAELDELYAQIGRLTTQNEWLKKKIWPLSCVLPSAASWLILEAQSFRFLNRRSFWGLTGQACTTDPYRPAGRSWILRRALTRSILPIRNSATAGSVRG